MAFCYTNDCLIQKEIAMSKLVPTRVIEICPGEWVVQFAGGVGGWTTFSDVFATEAEAKDFETQQIASADLGE
jgi:hypothetical protein